MSSNAIYTFDREIEKTSDQVKAAEDVTSENPLKLKELLEKS